MVYRPGMMIRNRYNSFLLAAGLVTSAPGQAIASRHPAAMEMPHTNICRVLSDGSLEAYYEFEGRKFISVIHVFGTQTNFRGNLNIHHFKNYRRTELADERKFDETDLINGEGVELAAAMGRAALTDCLKSIKNSNKPQP